MSVFRWLIPVVLFACLGGCLLGYLVPRIINNQRCLVNCGAARGIRLEHKPVKAASDRKATPSLLSKITQVEHGKTLEIVVQTLPGTVCAISFQTADQPPMLIEMQFAGSDGRCRSIWAVPNTTLLGKSNLLICASACLEPIFFQIQ